MTETANAPQHPASGAADPFVTQVNWLIAAAGGKDQLVQRCGGLVSARTLDNWTAGQYPRTKVTGAVRDLDAWAAREMPGYPAAAGVPGLVASCGPYRGATIAEPDPARPEADPEPAVTGPPRGRRRWLRWALATAGLVVVVAATAVTTAVIVRHDDAAAEAAGASDATAAANSLARLPLPSTGNGTLYTEQAGSIGANTYEDPRTLAGHGPVIRPHTRIEVRCRYYAPSVPSVSPDGFWYLIDTDTWNGLWTPANSFMNGDPPGGPYTHNTDLAVPICR